MSTISHLSAIQRILIRKTKNKQYEGSNRDLIHIPSKKDSTENDFKRISTAFFLKNRLPFSFTPALKEFIIEMNKHFSEEQIFKYKLDRRMVVEEAHKP